MTRANPETSKTALAVAVPEAMVASVTRPDPMVSMIERVVLDPEADIAKLEKMIDLKDRLDKRQREDATERCLHRDLPPLVKQNVSSSLISPRLKPRSRSS